MICKPLKWVKKSGGIITNLSEEGQNFRGSTSLYGKTNDVNFHVFALKALRNVIEHLFGYFVSFYRKMYYEKLF